MILFLAMRKFISKIFRNWYSINSPWNLLPNQAIALVTPCDTKYRLNTHSIPHLVHDAILPDTQTILFLFLANYVPRWYSLNFRIFLANLISMILSTKIAQARNYSSVGVFLWIRCMNQNFGLSVYPRLPDMYEKQVISNEIDPRTSSHSPESQKPHAVGKQIIIIQLSSNSPPHWAPSIK